MWFYLFKMVGEVHLSIAHMHGNAYLFSQFVKVSLSDKIKKMSLSDKREEMALRKICLVGTLLNLHARFHAPTPYVLYIG